MKGNLILPVLLILSTTGCLDMIEEYLGMGETEFDIIDSFVVDVNEGKYESACSKIISYDDGMFLSRDYHQEEMNSCIDSYESTCGSNSNYCNLSIIYEYTFETEYSSNSTRTGMVNHVWTNMTTCIYTDEDGWVCGNERLKWHVMMNLAEERWGILGVDDGTYQACGEDYTYCSFLSFNFLSFNEEDEWNGEKITASFQTKVVGDDRAVRVISISQEIDACYFSWYLKDQMSSTVDFGDTCTDEAGEDTDCVTFYDNDSDGDMTAGDQYMVAAGCFGDDYSFDVKHDASDDIIGSANL